MIKVLQIPLGGHRRRKVSGILTPGSKDWVSREAPMKVRRWKSREEFQSLQNLSRDRLDKLALSSQPAMVADFEALQIADVFKKRAKAKYFTNKYMHDLITLDSPLKKSYINTLYCSTDLKQEYDKITTKYCKNRWCLVCNRIRIAKCINGYMPELKKLHDPQFVTLTIPNVKREKLRETIRDMIGQWSAIYKKLHRWCKQLKIPFAGIRKIECTFNFNEDTYHPHFHFIISNKTIAETIVAEWLNRYPSASPAAQKIIPADEGSMLELFKYFTKIITKGSIYISPMDIIFQCIKGFRIYQPFGIRAVDEEPNDLEAISIEGVAHLVWWKWHNNDWYNTVTDEPLSGFSDTTFVDKLFESVIL